MDWREDPGPYKEEIFQKAVELGLPEPLARFLGRCSFLNSTDELDSFLEKNRQELHSPLKLNDMDRAVTRLVEALEREEEILVFGDFDVDGLCGAATLYWGLRKARKGVKPRVYLPHRFTEGHGLSKALVERFHSEGVRVIVTADCGMGSPGPLRRAGELGLDVIVTDHHPFEEDLSGAFAIVNPKLGTYPFPDLAGSGVAFKLVQALVGSIHGQESEQYISVTQNCIDYVAIGTIADVVPLRGENRILAHWGLSHMAQSKLPFLSQYWKNRLIRSDLGEVFKASHIGFQMAPMLNAASRLESPTPAFQFLTSVRREDVIRHGNYLESLNQERRKRLSRLMQSSRLEFHNISCMELVVVHTHSSELGLLGLVAARLSDELKKTVVAIGFSPDGLLRGSGRGSGTPPLQDVFKAVGEHLEGYGGHKEAAGLQMHPEKFRDFLDALENIEACWPQELEQEENIADCRLTPDDLGDEFLEALEALGPFGEGFQEPLFLMEGFSVIQPRRVGGEKQHLSFRLEGKKGTRLSGIAFGHGESEKEIISSRGLVGHLSFNFFREREIQFRLRSFVASS
jgi:single-stranded-DNA-specific exonuclease